MDHQQQYCLKWSNYSSNLATAFSNLFESETLTDVTLFCGGQIFKAHKLILAACSKNFADLFETAPANGSICVILEATSADNMSALLEFMYKGEVHVSQKALESFLKAAESLQVKGLTTEHGRFANPNVHPSPPSQQTSPLVETPTPTRGRPQRNNLSSSLESLAMRNSIKRETDMILKSSSVIPGFSPYLTPQYNPLPYEAHPQQRKRHLQSLYTEQEARGSVLRDGSKASTGSASPISKSYRPASSGSSVAPTEADTLQADRDSPHQSKSYENHSPSTTQTGNGPTAHSDHGGPERNGPDQLLGGGKHDQIDEETQQRQEQLHNSQKLSWNILALANRIQNENEEAKDFEEQIMKAQLKSNQNGAEDLRVKMEMRPLQSPIASSIPPTPTTPIGNFVSGPVKGGLPGGLDMLTILGAAREIGNTSDAGKKLQCPLCDRQYGYETNLRAHIRQRHQGIRVPCPYCSRTFTRNNTVRRHIAREHKQQYLHNQMQS